jgi:Lrp/AsnC family leucine-responsive transcriptional regulator
MANNAEILPCCDRILCMDEIDSRILALLSEDGRRSFDDIARRVALSAPAVKRRVDRLRASGTLQGVTLDAVTASLRRVPEVVEAWSVSGEPDAIAHVRTRDNADLERLIRGLQADGAVVRTRSQIVLSRLVHRRGETD